jgi:hypothetical protein
MPRPTKSGQGNNNLRHDLQLNGYPQGFIDSVVNPKGSSRPKTEEEPLGSLYVYIPYVKGVSEKFMRIGNRYIRRSAFIAFPVNVAEAALAKQADLWPCGSVNIGIISNRVFWKNRN